MSETILKNESETADAISEEKAYTLRKVDAQDIAPLATIISKIGFREFKECFENNKVQNAIENGELDVEKLGIGVAFDIAGIVIMNIPKCINEMFAFIASLTGMDVEKVKKFDLDVMAEIIIDIFQKEEFKKVFKVASKLFK